jgi:hypothetical protein
MREKAKTKVEAHFGAGMERNESSLRRPGLSDLSPCVLAANDLNQSLAGDNRTLDGAPSPSF